MGSSNPSSSPEQLVLDLPHREAVGLEDFLVSQCNEAAVHLIDSWPNWTTRGAIVVGPAGSGKSHLTNVWRLKSGAGSQSGSSISEDLLDSLRTHRAIAIEDIDKGIGDERIFFHILNLLREKNYALLVTSQVAPGHLSIKLPDLRSRLLALPVVHINSPDSQLLKAVMIKLFSDRQLSVEPHVVNYIATHMERSFESARYVVEACDQLSLSQQRQITRVVAAEVLAMQAHSGQEESDFLKKLNKKVFPPDFD